MNITFKGNLDGMNNYLNDLTKMRRLHVSHYEDEARDRQIQAMIDSEVEGDFTGPDGDNDR